MIECRVCTTEKPESEYYPSRLKRGERTCKSCAKSAKETWRRENPDKVRASKRRWTAENAEHVRAYKRANPELRSWTVPAAEIARVAWSRSARPIPSVGCGARLEDVSGRHQDVPAAWSSPAA